VQKSELAIRQKIWCMTVDTYDEAKMAPQFNPVTTCEVMCKSKSCWIIMVDGMMPEQEIDPLTENNRIIIANSTKGIPPIFSNP